LMAALLQEIALGTAAGASPVPLRPTNAVPFPVALLVMVIVPDAAPAVVGSNFTSKVADCPGLSVTGKLAPDIEKADPVSVAVLMVSAEVPVEVSVTVWVDGVFTFTSPNVTLVALRVKAGAWASSCTA